MITVTLKMPDTLAKKLKIVAKKRQMSQSAIIRYALERYIDKDLPDLEQPSVFDLVKEYAGTVEGPRDLSTNPKHMEKYGK